MAVTIGDIGGLRWDLTCAYPRSRCRFEAMPADLISPKALPRNRRREPYVLKMKPGFRLPKLFARKIIASSALRSSSVSHLSGALVM